MSTYIVQPGDTMWKIANDHGVTLAALIAANPQIKDPGHIEVGWVINIPPREGSPAPNPNPNPNPTNPNPGQPGTPPKPPAPGPGKDGFKTVGYFVNWGIYGRNYQPQTIPAAHITHILYSFANVRPETGEVYLSDTYADLEKHYPEDSWSEPGNNVYGCVKQLFLLKKKHRHFHTLLSIGGWTYSANFPVPASTPQGRERFAKSAVKLVADLGFDGLDVDWEYPKDDTEAKNFVLLLEATRKELDNFAAQAKLDKKKPLLTIAAPCGEANYSKLHMAEMDKYLDFWNLMCYDFAGSWGKEAGHQANVFASKDNPKSTPFNADSAIKAYIKGGVKSEKIIFGMPLYGRAFENTDGPGKPYQGIGDGSWEKGVWDYKALPRGGAEEKNDDATIASWSYSGAREMVSYDTPHIAKKKVEYIKNTKLGGAMWWELSGDQPIDKDRSLIKTTVDAFGGNSTLEVRENNLHYPTSQYDNVKKGFTA
ncbi:hypothetical protein FQN57_001402 [Myotisia sp. PD_48]|nr:hypothetical protein FQN57_001402 [Myotisia sp. PD_48]